jgi:hypothetical protein
MHHLKYCYRNLVSPNSSNKCSLPDLGKLSPFSRCAAKKSPVHPSRNCRRYCHITGLEKFGNIMKIEIKAFNKEKYFDLAIDTENDIFLIGIPFNNGPAEHTNYYQISEDEYRTGIENTGRLNHLVNGQKFLGNGSLYYSTFSS